MSFDIVRSAIENTLRANWSLTGIEFENLPIDTDGLSEYISVNILDTGSNISTIGNGGQYISSGVVLIAVFTPKDTGSARARELADNIATIFRAKKISGLSFRAPKGRRVRSDSDYFQFNVSIPFYAFFNL